MIVKGAGEGATAGVIGRVVTLGMVVVTLGAGGAGKAAATTTPADGDSAGCELFGGGRGNGAGGAGGAGGMCLAR